MGTARTGWFLVGVGVLVQETCDRRVHKVVQVRAGSLRSLEPPGAYKDVPRRVLDWDGHSRRVS